MTVIKSGYITATVTVIVTPGSQQEVTVDLQPEPTLEETVTVVAATRTNRRLEDQPMRVEVLEREEIEEKMLMTPGDIVMMLNEMGGMRVQATSPSLGAASVRIQGMRGRYTRVLSDGLPLFGDVGGLGLLQIPPMDLGQVEVIKGVASALYGAGAMGGIVNLLSRRPGGEAEREFLLNRSTRGATDAVTYLAAPLAGAVECLDTRRRALAEHDRCQRGRLGGPARLLARRRPPSRVLGRWQRPDRVRHHGRYVRRSHWRDARGRVTCRYWSTVRRSARHPALRRRGRRSIPR